jgi:hypothetical protein
MFYKTQNKQEYMFLIDFAKSKGILVTPATCEWSVSYPLLQFKGDALAAWKDGNGISSTLSEFIKAMEEYKKPFMIGEHKVQFYGGSIKVGCTRVSNELVREIAKNLID